MIGRLCAAGLLIAVLVGTPSGYASSSVGRCAFTSKDLPHFVLKRRDLPAGARLYDSGTLAHFGTKGTVDLFAADWDWGPRHVTTLDPYRHRAATSAAFLFRNPAAAAGGLAELKQLYLGVPSTRKAIPDGHLGQQRWALSSQFGLPDGFHYGWRVDNVDLVFSYRGELAPEVTARAALALAEKMARLVHC